MLWECSDGGLYIDNIYKIYKALKVKNKKYPIRI